MISLLTQRKNSPRRIERNPNHTPFIEANSFKRMAAARAGEEQVKVIGWWASPYVARARIALNLKGIDYEFLQEELGKKSELLLKSNPVYKKVPVLIHGGKIICESLIIVQYIDEAWAASAPSILPADPYDRAVARFWGAYLDDKISPHIGAFIREADEATRAVAKEQLVAALQQMEEELEKSSKVRRFFGGDSIGYVDIALGSYLGGFKAFEKIAGIKFLDEQKIPHLVKWSESFCSTDAAKEVIPEAHELVELCKLR